VSALRVLGLLVYVCGAFAYGALVFLALRDWREYSSLTRAERKALPLREVEVVGGILNSVCFVWFVLLALLTVLQLGPPRTLWPLEVANVCMAFTFPPLIMHITFAETASHGRRPAALWRAVLWPMYAAMLGTAIWSVLVFARVIQAPIELAERLATIALSGGFIFAAIYSIALVTSAPRRAETVRERQSRRWHLVLFLMVVLIFGLIVSLAGRGGETPATVLLGLLEISAKSLPLAFLFVAAYFEHRFEFFDLFVKRGLSLLLTIGVLTAAFALTLPLLRSFEASDAAPWVYAVVLLPVVTALPWLYGHISKTLDRRWLGRRFTTVEAVTRFIAALRSATTEHQLIERAEEGLSEIFDASVCVQLDSTKEPASFQVVHEVAIGSGTPTGGRILMGQRASEAPYFSEDAALLTSLADVLASVVANLTLQRREREQDQRARELTLHASRSELKALRAQINPHFLFNALNAIAGLIHTNPAVADRTIEQLADVFRYALRGAETEWAVLDDELEFVRAYLEVEQARFGSRLHIDVRAEDAVRRARVPTMMVQTLVENAVKHGVAPVRSRTSVEVDARRENDRLLLTVSDTGPGFGEADRLPRASGTNRPGERPRTGGYGLANVRQRLDGYFGSAAALTIDRDESRGRTIVSVSMPFEVHDGRPAASATTSTEAHR
jgi:signal transduction histidine kinase